MAFNIGLLSEESDDGSEGLDTEETIGGEEEQAPEEADGEDAGEEAAPEESADAPEEEQEVAPEDKPRPEVGEMSVDKVVEQSKEIEQQEELDEAKEDIGTAAAVKSMNFSEDEDEVNAKQIAVELEGASDAIEKALGTAQTLDAIHGQFQTALPYGGIEAPAMEAIQIAINHMRARLGYPKSKGVSLEGFKNPVTKRERNVLAMEGIATSLKNIWEAILNSLKRVMGWIKDFFGFFFKARDKQVERTKQTKAVIKEALDEIKAAGPDKKKIIEDIAAAGDAAIGPAHENDEISKIVESVEKKKKDKKPSDKLTEEEIQKALDLRNKIREAATPLRYGDFHLFRLDNKVLDAKGILKGIADTVSELEEDYKDYLDHSKFKASIQSYEKIMGSLTSTEDRRALLGELQLVKANLQSGNDVKKDEVTGEKELVRVSLTGYIGDYCISTIAPKDPDDLLAVEKHIGKIRLEFVKDPDYNSVTLDNNAIVEKVRADDLMTIQEYLDKLANIYDKKLSDEILAGIESFEHKAAAIAEKMKSEQTVDSETIQLALGLSVFVKNLMSIYPSQIYTYLGRLQDHVNNYTRSLARKYFVISKRVAEI
jgi:hypothetical protein